MSKPVSTLHHKDGRSCDLCEFKLTQAHPDLADWFRSVKARYINAHVSWSYRGPEDQEKAYSEGKSKAHYPFSPHNNTFNDRPYALALDLFLINEDGEATFPPLWYAKVDRENRESNEPIIWGGRFRGKDGRAFHDCDHYQLMLNVDHAV